MKIFILFIIFLNGLYAKDYNIICPGDANSSKITDIPYSFSVVPNDDDNDNTVTGGELETCDCGMPYWDSTSPVCGGDASVNVIKSISNNECDDDSFVFTVGDTSGVAITEYDSDNNLYKNAVIIVNGLPCLNNDDAVNMTLAVYDEDDNSNYGLVTCHGLTTKFEDDAVYDVTDDEKAIFKSVCAKKEPETTPDIDYVPYLEKIITNTAFSETTSDNIKSLNERDKKIDDNLNDYISNKDINSSLNIDNDLVQFNDTFETTLSDSYSTYSDVFGFGGYGVAPDPISFTMFDKDYKVFDPTLLDPYIDNIRDIIAIFAYLWGFIVVFRGI